MGEIGFADGKAVSAVASCRGATLALSGTSTWAVDGKAMTGFTDHAKSDGYKAVLNTLTSTIVAAKTWGLFIESPETSAKSAVFGIYGAGAAAATTLAAIPVTGWWAPDTFKIAALTAPTAITLATNGLVQTCTGATGADAAALKTSYETAVVGLTTAGNTITSTWYQPKQEATNIYKTMPRFSKKDKVLTYGGSDATAVTAVACSTGIELTGASALVAGAAVVFGASALAF